MDCISAAFCRQIDFVIENLTVSKRIFSVSGGDDRLTVDLRASFLSLGLQFIAAYTCASAKRVANDSFMHMGLKAKIPRVATVRTMVMLINNYCH